MRLKMIAAAVVAAFTLGACETFDQAGSLHLTEDEVEYGSDKSISLVHWAPGNYDGQNAGRIIMPNPEGGDPVVVELVGAKEQGSVALTWDMPDGTKITYSATDVRAFQGQEARNNANAALAAALGELWQNVTPDIKSGAISALCLGLTGAPC